jgi:hypothetical protein
MVSEVKESKYKSTDENGQMHLQMKLILQSNEII